MNIHTKSKIICILILLLILIGNLQISNANKISMAYLYGNYDYISLVERNENALNVVSPSYFDLDSNGNLVLNQIDQNLINEMHNKGIKVTPFLSNHWDKSKGRAALANIEKLTNDIVVAIKKYNLDGINVDIENVTDVDRENYTKLVRVLREKLPKDKVVSVAVAANPYNWQTGWHGSYDYSELAKYSDYLMIMAYDEHYESGVEGAVAGIDFVENSIKYALSKVSSDKIVVGIPFYGRYWKNGSSYGGYGVTLDKISELINRYESHVTYDEKNECAVATIKIKSSDIKPSIYGRTLYEGTYKFYYENEKSIQAKIELVEKYNLKGIGCWSLGQETNDVWSNYARYLGDGEKEFKDVEEVTWAKDAIEFVKEKGWITGRNANDYEPNSYLTRAELATIIARILELDITSSNETLYVDVNYHWGKNAINALTKTGLMEGYGDKTFRPDKYVTREETAKILCLLEKNLKIKESLTFSDVKSDRWSYEYIKKMAEKGILKGYEDGSFRPENGITRAEIAVVLERMYK